VTKAEDGVPRVSMDYFFLGDARTDPIKDTIINMTTKDLRNKLNIAQLPAGGRRPELEERYDEFRKKTLAEAGISSSEDEGKEEDQKEGVHPAIIMLVEETGNRCMIIVDQKTVGDERRNEVAHPRHA